MEKILRNGDLFLAGARALWSKSHRAPLGLAFDLEVAMGEAGKGWGVLSDAPTTQAWPQVAAEDDKFAFGWLPIEEIRPYRSNPRRYPARMLKQLERTVAFTTVVSPILVDEDNVVIAGHARLLVAKTAGMGRVPVITVRGLTEAQQRTLRIADNKIRGEWDLEILKIELEALNLELPDLELTGFKAGEADLILGDNFDDDEPPQESVPPRAKLGDIWRCGEHFIACGDARDPGVFARLMGDDLATACVTDPPFNLSIRGFANRSSNHREFAAASGEMSDEEFEQFIEDCLSNAVKYSTRAAVHFIFMDWRHMEMLCRVGRKLYNVQLNLCIWNKSNGGMGGLYRSKHELIFVLRVGSEPHRNNVELGRYGRNRSNVLDYPSVNTFNAGRRDDLKLHPTVKPVAMISDFIKDVTQRAEIVLDPFLGSGTSLIAAERVGRRLRAIEIDPAYVGLAIQRWEAITGEKAVLVGSTSLWPTPSHSTQGVAGKELHHV